MTETHPDATVAVWAEDEHRFGLLPVTRWVWARRGHRPTVGIWQRYQWLYLYGVVQPATVATWMTWRGCQTLRAAPPTIAALTHFGWWSSTPHHIQN